MTTQHTFESFVALAEKEGWTRKKTRSNLFALCDDALWARRDEICVALGFAPTDEIAKDRQAQNEVAKAREAEERAAAQADLVARQAQARVEREAREEAEREAQAQAAADAYNAIADGAVIWCDAAENTVVRVVNSYGKQHKFDNGGYRVAVVCGGYVARHVNTKCPDQFAGECYSVLKAVELAVECKLASCTIRNDRIGGFEANTKKGYIGAKYLWIARKMADEAGVAVTFDQCSGKENKADAASRSEG